MKRIKIQWIIMLCLIAFVPFVVSCKQQDPLAQELPVPVIEDPADVSVMVQSDHLGISTLSLGVTYMQYNLNGGGDLPSIERGRALLKEKLVYHNQHIFGFGAGNLEPNPGVYEWNTLDARVSMMEMLGGIPVITLATAPTWMTDPDWKPGQYEGETDWSKIEHAPLPKHVDAFAALCAKVASRYPQVIHFQVWNEMKGMWHATENRWDYERYLTLYNAVYDAVKKVRPDAKLGGPYVVMDSWKNPGNVMKSNLQSPLYGTVDKRTMDVVEYWLEHKHGAEFITIDGGVRPKDDASGYNAIEATQKFHDVSQWIKSKTELPLWWAEDYVNMTPEMAGDTLIQSAALAAMLAQYALSGVNVSLRWAPEAQRGANEMNLFSSTRQVGGGYPFSNYFVYRDFHKYFPSGIALRQVRISEPRSIMALASSTHIMLINKTSIAQRISLQNSKTVDLRPYQVVFESW